MLGKMLKRALPAHPMQLFWLSPSFTSRYGPCLAFVELPDSCWEASGGSNPETAGLLALRNRRRRDNELIDR